MHWDDWLMAAAPLLALGVSVLLLGRQLARGAALRRPAFLVGILVVVLLAPSAMAIRLVNVYQRGVLDGMHAATAAVCRAAPPWAPYRPGMTSCPGQGAIIDSPAREQHL